MSTLIDVVADFETYWAADYTLRDLTIPEYVLGKQFEIIGLGLKLPGHPATWYSGDLAYMQRVAAKLPWHRIRVIMHHAFFDGSILEWVLKVRPAQYFCTMMASRPFVVPYTGKMSLDRVGRHLGLSQTKGDDVMQARGLHRVHFEPEHLRNYGRYCCNDVEMTGQIAKQLIPQLPADELDLIDLTVKKFLRPTICLDLTAIEDRQVDLTTKREFIEAKAQLLGAAPSALRSRTKFAAVLEKYGVQPPEKRSARTGEMTFAFAKTDLAFAELLTHTDERIRTLVEAKLFTSSTLESKRLERFATLYNLDVNGVHHLPVPLLYYGAGPGRFSGYDKINLQNLPRVARDKLTKAVTAGHLKFALVAPPGYKIVAGDLSNIEARLVATLAKCWILIKAFSERRDVYSEFASKIYGRLITKMNEIERFVGKTCILGLGYGMGWEKFLRGMRLARIRMDAETAQRIVYLYRDTYAEVQQMWHQLEQMSKQMLLPTCMVPWGPVTFLHERILLPNGMPMIYPELQAAPDLTYASTHGRGEEGRTKLWGGLVAQNLGEALARIIVTTAELRLARAGLPAALQVHDELIYVVPDRHVEAVTKALEMALTAPVPWLPNLPLACEIKHGQTYGDAK